MQPTERTLVSDYVTVNGVRSWYSVQGAGEPLVLLHGGFSDSRDFEPSLSKLAGRFTVYLLDRRAHGRTPDVEGPVSLEMLADDVAAFMDKVVGGPAHVAGYSSGGVVALALALRRPELVRRLVLISTGYSKEGWMFLPDPDGADDFPAMVVDRYAEVSPDGRDHFPVMARKFAAVESEADSLRPDRVSSPTLVLAADDDIVHLSHTIEMYQAIPQGQLAIVPAASHLLLFEKPDLCTQLVAEFLTTDPAPVMPVRRAVASTM
jgi:pimeloyl-ACP methyl ester carboxylesterase